MKLLTRTVRNYVILSALLLVISTPLFYYSIQRLFVHKMDQELIAHKQEFYELQPRLKSSYDLELFGLMNDEFFLKESKSLMNGDSILTLNIYNNKAKRQEPWRILRTGVMVLGKPYVLRIRESMVNTTDLVSAIAVIQVALLSLLLAGLVLVNRKLSRTIWGPFHTILDKLKKYQIDKDTFIDLPQSSTAEFRDLSAVITQLVKKNHDAFQSQKEFTENASHEIQTPLAICRSKLELLAQTQELTEEQAELVEGLFDATERITRLTKNLLLLTKIENRQFFDLEDVRLLPLIKKCSDALKRQVDEKQLSVRYLVSEDAAIHANPVLVEVLLSNLISNAVRHAKESSTISIEGSGADIAVSNSGAPLEHPGKIFDRFHRESRTSVGNGLGLSIVKKVCEVAGYQVEYTYSESTHYFKILF